MLIFLLFLLPISSFASEAFVGAGTHNIAIGYREDMWDGIYAQAKVGYLAGEMALIGSGLRLDFKPVEVRAGMSLGPVAGKSIVTSNAEVYLGLVDRKGNAIGFQVETLSNTLFGVSDQYLFSVQLSQRW